MKCPHCGRDFNPRFPGTLEERLFRYREIDVRTGCWNWSGRLSEMGYAHMTYRGRQTPVHRLAAELWLNWPSRDLSRPICHKCHNRRCFNPEHLYIGTVQENNRDRWIRWNGKNPQGGKVRLSLAAVAEAKSLLAQGATYSEVARRFDVQPTYVSKLVRRNSSNVKLTVAQVGEIRKARAAGALLRELSQAYGITMTTISNIARQRTWKRIEELGNGS